MSRVPGLTSTQSPGPPQGGPTPPVGPNLTPKNTPQGLIQKIAEIPKNPKKPPNSGGVKNREISANFGKKRGVFRPPPGGPNFRKFRPPPLKPLERGEIFVPNGRIIKYPQKCNFFPPPGGSNLGGSKKGQKRGFFGGVRGIPCARFLGVFGGFFGGSGDPPGTYLLVTSGTRPTPDHGPRPGGHLVGEQTCLVGQQVTGWS